MKRRPAGPRRERAARARAAVCLAGPDCPEETVRLVIGPGGKEQRVNRAVVRSALAENKRPETVDQDRLAVDVLERTDTLVRPGRLRLIRVDLAVTEVADEQIPAEGPEPGGSHRHAPGCVELAAVGDPLQED